MLFCLEIITKQAFLQNFYLDTELWRKLMTNYIIKNTVNGLTSQAHLKDLIVSPMIYQVLDNMPPTETFGRNGKYTNFPQMALKN